MPALHIFVNIGKTVYLFTRIRTWPNNTINPYSVQPEINDALKEGLLIWHLQLFLAIVAPSGRSV